MRLKHTTRTTSYATTADHSVALGKLFGLNRLAPKTSSFLPIQCNDEALAWRLVMIDKAEKTIDAQYYSWHSDISGQLLLARLTDAANRGVRVRLLLDDIHTFGADRRIAILNHHQNIEVRLFNPFHFRWPFRLVRLVELLWRLDRLNHRMHNKIFIADNVVSIVGGRNIGDEYFGLDKDYVFRDLDLLTCGDSVSKFSQSFDIYWNSSASKPAKRIIAFRPVKRDFNHFRKYLDKKILKNIQIVKSADELQQRLATDPGIISKLKVATGKVFYDLPELSDYEPGLLTKSLDDCSSSTQAHLTIVSAYFIPTDHIINSLLTLIKRGIKVQIYTNSLASIDVTAAFSGYQRYRKKLLSIGAQIFEYKACPDDQSVYITPAINATQTGLHAKTIIFDYETVYVGTLNLDPRSATLNTEIGILVHNLELASEIRLSFHKDYAQGAFWQVELDNKGRPVWRCGAESTFIQPARGPVQRLANFIYSLLPIHRHL